MFTRLRRPSLSLVVATLGTALTIILVSVSWKRALYEHEKVFFAQSEAVREQLLERIKATDEMIIGLATLVNSATHADADQFRLFSEELLRRHPYLLSTSYLPHVYERERRDFERSRHEAGFPAFAINDRSAGDYRSAPSRAQYFPLLFIEPFEPTSVRMIGFDVLSEPALAQAAKAAVDTAIPVAAAPRLIEGQVWGYWLFNAIYAGKTAPATAVERRETVNGLIALRIDSEKMLAESLAAWPLTAHLRMIPAGGTVPQDLAARQRRTEAGLFVKTFTHSAQLGSGGQRFLLHLQRGITWGEVNYLPVITILVAGLVVTILLVQTARRVARRTQELEQKNIEVERLVTEKTAELALEKERAQVTLASIGDAVITTDAAGRVEYLNAVAETLTGWTRTEAHGRGLDEVFRVRTVDDESEHTPLQPAARREWLLVNRSLKEIAIDQSVAPICGRAGEMLGSVVVFRDVSQQRQVAREMSYQAAHDALTGLYNRRAFEERLDQLHGSAKSNGDQHALLYLDLDQFKIVNDACGHSAGDELLRQLSALLRKESRQTDALARLGGDELGVLLQNCQMPEAERVADKLLQTINDFRFAWNGRVFTIGASIGLVPFDGEWENAASILSAADAACYAAKDKGRNRVLTYQSDDIELNQRRTQMQWVTRLKHALDENRFLLCSQPIVPTSERMALPLLHEVLLCLREEDDSLVPPGAFLPAAERYGLITDIDRWVVNSTLQWLAAHQNDPRLARSYSINLSGQTLSDPNFLGFVLQEIERSGVAAKRLAFEITETAAVATLENALQLIETLKAKGCRFLLDDFGSGWSSFAYLKNLPVDFLKIDGSLVRDMANDELDEAMVRAINEIGHLLGIATVAEYVENAEVLERVTALGVDYAQGYALGRPAPIDAHLDPPQTARSQITA